MRLSSAFLLISAILPYISDGAVFKKRLTGEDLTPLLDAIPVILRSAIHPAEPNGAVFDNAARVLSDDRGPEIMHNGHNSDDGDPGNNTIEISVIVRERRGSRACAHGREDGAGTNQANHGRPTTLVPSSPTTETPSLSSTRPTGPKIPAIPAPSRYEQCSATGDYVYVYSVRAGRQHGLMILQRVRWDSMLGPAAYEG
ncbi:hypothetical protein K469DRAFT_681423 [Zopfia rhizophila CBS 207.26]|uniref:Uncharacterized protein n=1 Tax=Zopfia rhizophila CBS 207.26 TaxID=1314779 RepID=A0A6A6EY44_9PEZI|nr:hypothetical protein K469DRAFT_681423 [Zopfia rhizophila CBS 207.26]